jgi:hypothetical protein
MQTRDRGSVEAELVGKRFGDVLAEQCRRFDGVRDASKRGADQSRTRGGGPVGRFGGRRSLQPRDQWFADSPLEEAVSSELVSEMLTGLGGN